MKNIVAVLSLCLLSLPFFSSCNKEKEKDSLNTDQVRLVEINSQLSATNQGHINFVYDQNGRISKATSHINNQTATTMFDVSYTANEIMLTISPQNDPNITILDTIRLSMDANQRVSKRISKSLQEFRSPNNNPQRTFNFDTVLFEYDAAGLVKKEIRGTWDSTWMMTNGTGQVSINTTRTNSITNYTNTGGNLTSLSIITNYSNDSYQSGNHYHSSSSIETSRSYQYTQAYPNKTDFSNAIVLNEVNIFNGTKINKAYVNIPETISETMVEKNQNGSVINTTNNTMNRKYTYNAYGFVATMEDVSNPGLKTTFVYNQ